MLLISKLENTVFPDAGWRLLSNSVSLPFPRGRCPLIRFATPAPLSLPTSLALQAPSRPPGGALRRATAYATELGFLAASRPTASNSPRIPVAALVMAMSSPSRPGCTGPLLAPLSYRRFIPLRAASGTAFLRKSSRTSHAAGNPAARRVCYTIA